MMMRGALIAAVVLAIGAFACERKHDENKAGETTTTSGTVHEEQNTGSGYNYQPSPGVTGAGADQADHAGSGTTTGSDRNVGDVSGAGASAGTSGSSVERDTTMGTYESARDAGIATDFEKKDGGHAIPPSGSNASKAKSGENKSTTLGSGESGQYTGGKGTYGGKATYGTGTQDAKDQKEKK